MSDAKQSSRQGAEAGSAQAEGERETPPPQGVTSSVVQRKLIQRRVRERREQEGNDAGAMQAAAAGTQGGGGPLPHADKIQRAFGRHDVSGVSAHTDGAAAAASDAMGAQAFATGNNVAFKGTPDLHTAAHEAAHVVQQRAGVSLKGGVGQAGDDHEKHADAVADAVVAGKSAEGLLDARAGGGSGKATGGGAGAVQRLLSTETIGASDQAIVDQRAADRGETLTPRTLSARGGASVNGKLSTGPASMAANPAFEAEALRFEHNLGIAAYTRGDAPATTMAHQAKKYIEQKAGAEWGKKTAELERLLELCGSTTPRWSGSVGLGFDKLTAAFDAGNVATKMCHLENFYQRILAPDLLSTELSTKQLDKLIAAGNVSADQVRIFRDRKATAGAPGAIFHIPDGSEVKGQDFSRGDRHLGEGEEASRSKRKLGETGIALTPHELEFQRGGETGGADHEVHLRWEEGATKWALNEYNKWTFEMRQLSLPLKAGPSGTTNKLMNMGALLGSEPVDTRLACIGYLLPSHHHSLVEIMAAAAPHGCGDFISGQQMYTSIAPFSQPELRAFGGGRFPHEPPAGTT